MIASRSINLLTVMQLITSRSLFAATSPSPLEILDLDLAIFQKLFHDINSLKVDLV